MNKEELIPFVEEYWDCENNQEEKFSSPEEVLEKAKEKGWQISSYDYNAIYHSFGMKSPLEALVEEVERSHRNDEF